jgi:hypothetical protein
MKDVAERVLTDVELTKKFYRNNNSGNWKEVEHPNVFFKYHLLATFYVLQIEVQHRN